MSKKRGRKKVTSGGVNRHHIVPQSRIRNDVVVHVERQWHAAWHVMFKTCTPAEACRVVVHIMCPDNSWPPSRPWTQKGIHGVCVDAMRHTESRIAHEGPGIYWASGSAPEWLEDAPINLARLDGEAGCTWTQLFQGLQTIGAVCEMIDAVMRKDSHWPCHRLVELRRDIARKWRIERMACK